MTSDAVERPAWMHSDFRYPPSSPEAVALREAIKPGPDYVPNLQAENRRLTTALLETQASRIDQLLADRTAYRNVVETQAAALKEAGEALRPFAKAAALYAEDVRSDLPLSAPVLRIKTQITVGDLRLASIVIGKDQ